MSYLHSCAILEASKTSSGLSHKAAMRRKEGTTTLICNRHTNQSPTKIPHITSNDVLPASLPSFKSITASGPQRNRSFSEKRTPVESKTGLCPIIQSLAPSLCIIQSFSVVNYIKQSHFPFSRTRLLHSN
ncbi:hypothetical protein DdX_04868 [Ditylenchus destructor]|uniref:Uncharacterized protein n=1 Tax=Ditylenchus destructor TaxID=166010 RepID=A0AAD4RAI2_9BILA|nr:hypothetical protein DdX_04868 [Ditylenchus destructor]